MIDQAFINVDQPLQLALTINSGQAFRWRESADGWLTGVLGGDIVRVRQVEGGVLLEGGPTPPAQMAGRLRAYLRLDDDLPKIQRKLSRDKHVKQGVVAYPGLRILRQDPWETLCAFILSSTSNIPRIARTVELLAATFGEPIPFDGIQRKTFPSPERMADAGEAALRALGCGFRAPFLHAAAQLVADGKLPLHQLRGARYEEAQEALMTVPGVGEKIADCVMLFALDRTEAFPVDRWIFRAMVEWYGTPEKFTYAQARQWAWERFGAYAGYANQYLFWGQRQANGATQPSGSLRQG